MTVGTTRKANTEATKAVDPGMSPFYDPTKFVQTAIAFIDALLDPQFDIPTVQFR